MDVNSVLQKVDEYYDRQQGQEAEKLMQSAIREAVAEGDDESLLQLLNELLGYYRETSQAENAFAIAGKCIETAERMGLQGTIPYATTLLNVANAYRAGGRREDSLELYRRVRELYGALLPPDHMFVAGLENNMSLLYQEMGDFREAKGCLLKALAIVGQREGAEFEAAVTRANLAGTCLQIGETEEAREYAEQAIREFEAMEAEDAHYGAALSALATYYYRKKEYARALEIFERTMGMIEKNLGKNEYYRRLEKNAEECRRALEDAPAERAESAEPAGQERPAERAESAKPAGQERPAERVESAEPAEQERPAECAGSVEPAEPAEGRPAELKGMDLCRAFYETCGRPMIAEKFPGYEDKIAVGLVGKGSDCFGYDDAQSRDHDWGPDFCLWVTEETFEAIGEELAQAYEELPREFQGCRRVPGMQKRGRRGVFTINGFFNGLLNAPCYEQVDWRQVPDYALANVINGEIFRDDEGIFTAEREKFRQGYPEAVAFLRMADSAARFSQAGQYNYGRVLERGDSVTAKLMLADSMREAMKLQHYIENRFPPHDKWLCRSMGESEAGRQLAELLDRLQAAEGTTVLMLRGGGAESVFAAGRRGREDGGFPRVAEVMEDGGFPRVAEVMEEIAAFLMRELYERSYISDSDTYLDAHSEELAQKSAFAACTDERLVEWIAEAEFQAFDKVKNVGGRASCQNDWATFSIMRKSQYMTWNRTMLIQYLYDFMREFRQGHNLIEEKYGRMMESTAPGEYERIKDHFPELTPEKKAIIEQIVRMQVAWMEEFAAKYPALADNARSVHTSDDAIDDTSYETYLRGEISTYSDKMLELYGRYVVGYARAGENLTFAIMTNSVRLYGYEGLDAAERFLKL